MYNVWRSYLAYMSYCLCILHSSYRATFDSICKTPKTDELYNLLILPIRYALQGIYIA